MGTEIRTEISRRNKHWIPKERYLELRHFCLQYSLWAKERQNASAYLTNCQHLVEGDNNIGRHVEEVALKIAELDRKMEMVKRCTREADPVLGKYVFQAVINSGITYTNLKTMYNIPCGRDMFYAAYRKFFWLLDKERG